MPELPKLNAKNGTAAAVVLALIAGISYIIYPSPVSLAWYQIPEPTVIDPGTGMPAIPSAYTYYYTLKPIVNVPDPTKECNQLWSFGMPEFDGSYVPTLRNGVHVGGGYGLATNQNYICNVVQDIIYVQGGDNNWWGWQNNQWNNFGSTVPANTVSYPIQSEVPVLSGQIMEVECVNNNKPEGWDCKAPFKQISDKMPGGTVELTVYSKYGSLQSPPSMKMVLRDAIVVIQESFNSTQIEAR